MKDVCAANYLTILKRHTRDSAKANQVFIGDLFIAICWACGNKGERYYNSKEISSAIMNRKADIPQTVRDCISTCSLEHMSRRLEGFFKTHISQNSRSSFSQCLLAFLAGDPKISKDQVQRAHLYSGRDVLLWTYVLEIAFSFNNKLIGRKIEFFNEYGCRFSLVFGDLLKMAFDPPKGQKLISVIPVNDEFSFHVDEVVECGTRPQVSPNTLHGKWVLEMAARGWPEQRLNAAVPKKGRLEGEPFHLVCGESVFYLLPISSFGLEGRAVSSREKITKAMERLLSYYDRNGQGVEMLVPLLGTGMSRAKISREQSLRIIKDALLSSAQTIAGSITIVCYEKDIRQLEDVVYEF